MEIRLRPEGEAAIREDVRRGAYQTVDEYVEHAIAMLHEQEAWLAAHRTEIQSKIDQGYAAAQRGELLDPDEVQSRLSHLKASQPTERKRG